MALSSGCAHVGVSFLEPKMCPNKCGQIVLNREFESHLKNICPMREVLCTEGCGNIILGKDMRNHAKNECIMSRLCERAELALREQALKELKQAMAQLYVERERAAARHLSHDGELSRRGWATSDIATRVGKIESTMRELVIRCRRRSKDRLSLALMTACNDAKTADKKGPPSAFKQLDTAGSVHNNRGARPWDLEAHGLAVLLDALEEASICGGNDRQRFECEAAVVSLLRRWLQAALLSADSSILEEVACDASQSLKHIELSSVDEILVLLKEVKNALHHAALAEVPAEETSLEFFDAVKTGDTEVATWLFDREQVNPSAVDPRSKFPPIVTVARSGDIDMCQLLLARRADVNARCELDGFSALHWAAHARSARVMHTLLHGGANPRLKDKKGQDCLMKLVRRDLNNPAAGCAWSWELQPNRRLPGPELEGSGIMDFEDAKVAAESRPDCVGISFRTAGVGLVPAEYCYFSLHGAATASSPSKPKRVSVETTEDGQALEAQPEQDDDDEIQWTSYLRVAANPAHDVIDLLAHGADACAVDNGGLSTLHHHLLSAPSRGSYQVVAALLRAQADVNVVDNTPRATTPLLLVVGAKRADLLRLMLTDAWPPADVDAKTSDGVSALALAEERGAREVIELLNDAGGSIWTQAETSIGCEVESNIFVDTRKPVGAEA